MLVLTSESTTEPVTLNEIKTHLRMESTDSTSEDGLLKSYITAARQQAENYTKRSFVTASRKVVIDAFEHSTVAIELPFAPLSTVSSNVSITYVKDTSAGDTTTIGSTVFTVDSDSEPGRIYPTYNNSWPTDVRDQRNAIEVSYITGYTTVSPTPESVKSWIKMRVEAMYENRGPMLMDTKIESLRRTFVDGLLDPYVLITAVS